MTTNYEDEAFVNYVFFLSGESVNLRFSVKPSIIRTVTGEASGEIPDWSWFETEDGLVSVDVSKVTAIFPENHDN